MKVKSFLMILLLVAAAAQAQTLAADEVTNQPSLQAPEDPDPFVHELAEPEKGLKVQLGGDLAEGEPAVTLGGRMEWVLTFREPNGDPWQEGSSQADGATVSPSTRQWALFGYGALAPDGTFGVHKDARNNVSLGLILGLGLGGRDPRPTGEVIGFFADLRKRVGTFEGAEGAVVQNVDQNLLGLGLDYYRPIAGNVVPKVTLTHYWVDDMSASEVPLPDDLVENQLRLSFFLEYPLNTRWNTECNVHLSAPTAGADRWQVDSLLDVALQYLVGKSWKAALRYRTGADMGLDIDEEVLLGALFEVF